MGIVHAITGWVTTHPLIALAIGLAFFAGSVVVTIAVLVRLPSDYFVCEPPRVWFASRAPAVRLVLNALRNLVGFTLIVLGIVMSVPGVPGQGLLTIVLGVMLADLPGKRRLERWLIARPMIRRAIDRLRVRRGRPPLDP
jgi:hypothetical protein